MLKKVIKYEDYDGNLREETHYFGLTKTELVKLRMSENGGLDNLIHRIVSEQDNVKLMAMFDEIILKAYGIKSLDGKSFEKSPEITKAFTSTLAYDALFIELMDSKKLAEFIDGILPADVAAQIKEEQAKNGQANVVALPQN